MPEDGREGPPTFPEPPPPPLPPAPIPANLAPFYARIDTLVADLETWGQATAKQVGLVWGPTPPERERGGG